MPAIHETAYPYLKRQPSPDELERLYTPTRAECDLAARQTKGPVARIGFLVLLKTLTQRVPPPGLLRAAGRRA